ncbi:MAG: ATP-dependent helicase [Candidatus Saccharimonadia bacterium]
MSRNNESLNDQQTLAVNHNDGPMLVVAGAGTGKTHVITSRIARLITDGLAKPGEILSLTFTEKAAREMAERLYELIGWQAFQVPVMTFHAFGSQLLLQFAPHIGRSTRGGLLTDTQKSLLLLQRIDKIELSYFGSQNNTFEFIEGIVEFINELQNAAISPQQYSEYFDQLKKNSGDLHPMELLEIEDMNLLYSEYDSAKSATGTYDYHDQLAIPLKVLTDKPNVAAKLRTEFKYVLVDEYQDTNYMQDQLLRSFILDKGNLFVVGDDDQSIYGFRGADISNIINFTDHFKSQNIAVLVKNYRSAQQILDGAYSLIQHNNPDRLEVKLKIDKHLIGLRNNGRIVFNPALNLNEEIEQTGNSIIEKINKGQLLESIAVLATSRTPLQLLAKKLSNAHVGYAISSQTEIFEQTELKQLWYLMEWLEYRASHETIIHLLLGPFFKLSGDSIQNLSHESRKNYEDIESTLVKAHDQTSIIVLEKLRLWRLWAQEYSVSQLGYKLIFETGISDELIKEAEDSNRVVRVFENLGKFFTQLRDFETIEMDKSLHSYFSVFPKPPKIETNEIIGESIGVQLLTVHSSKGLEFDTVFLINCTQSAWSPLNFNGKYTVPSNLRMSIEITPEQEYRRLMYVAVTRARNEFIASAGTYDNAGRRMALSRYLYELFPEPLPGFTQPENSTTNHQVAIDKLQKFYPLQSRHKDLSMPFETRDGWLELGVKDLDGYDYCPYDFYLEKVLKIAQPIGPQMTFGTALHSAFSLYYQAVLENEKIDEAVIVKRFEELWNNQGYINETQAIRAHQVGIDTLRTFIKSETKQTGRKIIATEFPIILELPKSKLRLKGKIDAIFETDSGVELWDFKTGGHKYDQEKLNETTKKNFQLRTYDAAYFQMTGINTSKIVLNFVVGGVMGDAELTTLMRKKHLDKLAALAENIRKKKFAPNKSAFHDCAAIRYYGSIESEEVDHGN